MTPIEETLHTLDDLVRAGKIRYIGCSNFSGWHLMKSLAISEKYGLARHVAHQAYYSLIGRDYEWELMPLALDQKVGTVVWSPLGWGRLTGKIRRGKPLPKESRLHETADDGPPVTDEHLYRVVDALDEVAKETGKTVPQIALNWLLQRPTIANVIIGARNEEQLRQNLGAVGWSLTPAQMPGSMPPARRRRSIPTGTSAASPSATRRRSRSRQRRLSQTRRASGARPYRRGRRESASGRERRRAWVRRSLRPWRAGPPSGCAWRAPCRPTTR